MAFRIKTTVGALVIVGVGLAGSSQAATYQVRHRHLHGAAAATLGITEESISFTEKKHSHEWKYQDIQQLTLSGETLRIETYSGQRWELGRDEVYVFDRLPAGLAAEWYPKFREKLDQRFVAALTDESLVPAWKISAKLLHGRVGSQGTILVAANGVAYKTDAPGESRTWRMEDIENISSSDMFDLTITTHERDFRFQLKQALSESQYEELWRAVNRIALVR